MKMSKKIENKELVSLKEIGLPLNEDCNQVDFDFEIESAKLDSLKKANKTKLINNLKWLKENDIELFYRPGGSVDYVYIFEYKGSICKVSALTLKVHFVGKGGRDWNQYKKDEKLLRVLNNSEVKEMREICNKRIHTFKIKEALPQERYITDPQFNFISSLLQKNRYEIDEDLLTTISIKDASLLIELLKNEISIIFKLNEEILNDIDEAIDKYKISKNER
jgi:hypothetical protein